MWFYVEDGCAGQINTCISRIPVPCCAPPMQYLSHWKFSPTAGPTEAFCGKPAPPHPPLHCSTVLTRASFIKNTDVAGRTSPGPLFCARSTVERNSIFQGDDVRSANMETGDWEESRCRVAEVAGMFWPHIICCDSSQDNACTWSIWQDVRYRFTLCVGVVRRASVQVKRQNNVMWQEAALQKRLFRAHKPCYHLSQNASLWKNGHPKSFPQKWGCLFSWLSWFFFCFLVSQTQNNTLPTDWYSLVF